MGQWADPSTEHAAAEPQLTRRSFVAAASAVAAGAVLLPDLLTDAPAAASTQFTRFVALPPTRLCETRSDLGAFGFTRLDRNRIRIRVAGRGGVPTDAVAAVFTLTGINRVAGGNHLRAYPAGTPITDTSVLNMQSFREVSPNLVTVELGVGGAVDVYAPLGADVLLDITGAYVPAPGPVRSGRFVPIDPVVRVVDTRTTRRKPRAFDVVRVDLTDWGVPRDATAVIANLTGVQGTTYGHLTAYPFGGATPRASNLNLVPRGTRAVNILTKLGVDSRNRVGFNVFVRSGAHVVVDVAGYMTGDDAPSSTEGRFVPVRPQRLVDTRRDRSARRRLWPGWTRAIDVPSSVLSSAQAVSVNLTATRSMGAGNFVLLGRQTPRHRVSNLNVTRAGQTIANHAVSRVSTSGLQVFSSSGGDVICDLFGWFSGTAQATSVGNPVNPAPPPGPTPWILTVPRMGLNHWVLGGDADRVVDAGHSWHWAGTGLVGQGGNAVAFGHRTSAGGPYRYQHHLRAGDLLDVITADKRRYTYRMAAEYLTGPTATEILAATRRLGRETFALVACTGDKYSGRLTRLPGGSTRYRMVSVFTFVGWADIAT
jgi:sortase (surface protein transpeptidase)